MFQRHVAFWLGAFFALILGLWIAFGIMWAVEESARDFSVFLFGVSAALIFVIIFAFFFGSWIRRKLIQRAEAGIDDFVSETGRLVSAIIKRDDEEVRSASTEIARVFAYSWAWTSLYRWVVGTCAAMFLGFAGFAGTILLFDQNEKIERQTGQISIQTDRITEQVKAASIQAELSSLELATNLRKQMVDSAQYYDKSERFEDFANKFSVKGLIDDRGLFDLPIRYDQGRRIAIFEDLESPKLVCHVTIQKVQNRAYRGAISEYVLRNALRLYQRKDVVGVAAKNAIHSLIYDSDPAVAFAGIEIVNAADSMSDNNRVSIVELSRLLLEGKKKISAEFSPNWINFSNSHLDDLSCLDCKLAIEDSYVGRVDAGSITFKGWVAVGEIPFSRTLIKNELSIGIMGQSAMSSFSAQSSDSGWDRFFLASRHGVLNVVARFDKTKRSKGDEVCSKFRAYFAGG